MIVIYQGVESVNHRDALLSVHDEYGVPIVGSLSYHSMKRRRIIDGPYLEETAAMMPLVLECGYSGESLTEAEAERLEGEYYDYLASSSGFTYAVQFSHPSLSGLRSMPDDPRIIPAPMDHSLEVLEPLLENRGGLAITYGDDGDKRVPALLRKHQGDDDPALCIALAQPDLALAQRSGFNAVMTQAWLGPEKYGELSLWDGGRFHRSSAEDRGRLLKRYGAQLQGSGFDPELLESNSRERARLSAWSFAMWALSLSSVRPANGEASDMDSEVTTTNSIAAQATSANSAAVPVKKTAPAEPKKRPVVNIPVFAVETKPHLETDADGNAVLGTRDTLRSSQEPIRSCDSCFLASTCPAYEAGSMCAFKVPVEVQGPDQVKALLNSMLEVQTTRVAFARYSEEVNGGYPDDVVGREMDRLFRMAEKVRKMDERRERLTVSVESNSSSSGDGAGVLSRIFGNSPRQQEQPQEIRQIEAESPEAVVREITDM